MSNILQQLAEENLRVEAAFSRLAQESPNQSFCFGLMQRLSQFHRANAEHLDDKTAHQFVPRTEDSHPDIPSTAQATIACCREMQWDLIRRYRELMSQKDQIPPVKSNQIENQFRDLQQMVAGLQYNASLSSA
jgi:LmbE family N-acetylglucosaminyl deacetylase